MTLKQIILLSLAIGFFVIGVHQTFYYPIAATYWLFMITAILLFLYYHDRKKQSNQQSSQTAETPRSRASKTTNIKNKKR